MLQRYIQSVVFHCKDCKMCNTIIVLLVLLPLSLGAVDVFSYINERGLNSYHYKFITDDFQEREETGDWVTEGDQTILRVKGYYSYINSDGFRHLVTYTADENGYRATVKAGETTTSAIAPAFGHAFASAGESEAGDISTRISSGALASLAGGNIG